MKLLSNVWNYGPLQGKKTYLAAFLGVLVLGLKAAGYIDEGVAKMLMEALAFLGLAAVRSAL